MFLAFLLDAIKASNVGLTPLLLSISFISIYSARRLFEIKEYKIVLLMIFVLTYLYALISGYTTNLIIYLLIFALAGVTFSYFSKSKFLF